MQNNLSKFLQILNILAIIGVGIGFWTNDNIRGAVQTEQIKDLNEKLNEFIHNVNERLDKSDEKIDTIYEQRH